MECCFTSIGPSRATVCEWLVHGGRRNLYAKISRMHKTPHTTMKDKHSQCPHSGDQSRPQVRRSTGCRLHPLGEARM